MMLPFVLTLLLSEVKAQDLATPSSFVTPRNYNKHPFDAVQFLRNLQAEPTKKGPILFPTGPPPPPRPLVVTSRPLLESIAKSDLNTSSLAASSQVNEILKPGYLARVQEYKPFEYRLPVNFGYDFGQTGVPYSDILKKVGTGGSGNRYNDYEERTILPPIYKALSNYAQEKLKIQQKSDPYDYQIKNPDYTNDYQSNDINDGTSSDYNQGENYAFSYAVKDQKTGDDFSHAQRSTGSATNGEYRVRLPDGRMQIVSYTADENGYNANVRYDEDKPEGNVIDNRYNDYHDNRNDDYHNKKNNDYIHNQNNDNLNNEYTGSNVQIGTVNVENRDFKSDYNRKNLNTGYYPDVSKEYDDYSSEYNGNYPQYKSKFSVFDQTNYNAVSTVKPSYEELKDLLVNQDVYRARQSDIPSSHDVTSEKIVVIGTPRPSLFTNFVDAPVTESPTFYTTARSYLVSTIANLKNKISLSNKPILSDGFIERINKYLKYK